MTPPDARRRSAGDLVLAADLAGTLVFAAEGALIAMAARLDLLGVAAVGFVSALGGGILRDLLLGAAPPAALKDGRYIPTAVAGAAVAVLLGARLHGPASDVLLVLDAAGLSLFAAAGTQKALQAGAGPAAAALLGALTATGGGAIRDVLLATVPAILRTDFYATAALAGAAVLIGARRAGISARGAAWTGGLSCFALRLLGAALHWRLPAPGAAQLYVTPS